MVTEYKGNIGDTQNSIHGEENIVDRQYSELKIITNRKKFNKTTDIMKKINDRN
ncbi:hypothetical protein BANRA_05510 [Escherichia coli]|uniref:Uncharacterized protein n=2 Tax=Escherichia coli TaxID=562 RepID=A0A3P5HCK2_ECOLX|nr:hypothetical protein BANRA_05510 [Escherichia coli]